MAEVMTPEAEQPALDESLMNVDSEVPADYSDKIEIVSVLFVKGPARPPGNVQKWVR